MTFSQDVKEELMQQVYDTHQLKCVLSSFLKNNITLKIINNKITWETHTQNNPIIRFITKSLFSLYKIDKKISYNKNNSFKKNTTYRLEFCGETNLFEKELYIFENPSPLFINDDAKKAFIVGAFLSGGSINNPKSSNYHFEIRSHNIDLINDLKKIFDEMHINSNVLTRGNLNIIYVKKSEHISDLLKYMNAQESMFLYEDKRIYRDYSNQIQRLNNLDISNIKKTINASNKQILYINEIKKNNDIYEQLSKKEKIFCEIRIQNPDASLNNIVDIFKNNYDIECTRSGLNHYSRKLKTLYESIK